MKTLANRIQLRARFNQLKIDHEEILSLERAIHELQQLKFSLQEKFYQAQKSYQADQRSWYESTHETKVVSTKSQKPTFEDILAELIREELAKKKGEKK